MAYQGIGTGTTPNDNSGDSLLTGAIKINSNFEELYTALGDGNTITFDQNRNVNTGDGLSGGGNLTADRTLTVDGTVLRTSGGQTIDGSLTATSFVGNGTIPVGGIIMWSGSIATIPSNWSLCNGSNGTPNLQDRFVVGAGSGYGVGATGGANSVTLTVSEMPTHSHGGVTGTQSANHRHAMPGDDQLSYGNGVGGWSVASVGNFGYDATSQSSGGNGTMWLTGFNDSNHNHAISPQGNGQAHENRPPYYALAFIMRTA
jgi:microcystin-dependent protein